MSYIAIGADRCTSRRGWSRWRSPARCWRRRRPSASPRATSRRARSVRSASRVSSGRSRSPRSAGRRRAGRASIGTGARDDAVHRSRRRAREAARRVRRRRRDRPGPYRRSSSARPGIGKSRLVHEFLRAVVRKDALALDGGAAPYSSGAGYRPGVHILRQYFNIGDTDDVKVVQEKVAGRIVALDGDTNAVGVPLLALLRALPANHRFFDLPVERAPPARVHRADVARRRGWRPIARSCSPTRTCSG